MTVRTEFRAIHGESYSSLRLLDEKDSGAGENIETLGHGHTSKRSSRYISEFSCQRTAKKKKTKKQTKKKYSKFLVSYI